MYTRFFLHSTSTRTLSQTETMSSIIIVKHFFCSFFVNESLIFSIFDAVYNFLTILFFIDKCKGLKAKKSIFFPSLLYTVGSTEDRKIKLREFIIRKMYFPWYRYFNFPEIFDFI